MSTEWLRRYHPAPDSAPRLVCFPHAGGSASFFYPVSARFGPEADVLAVQYPGRQDRRGEPVLEDIGELADRVAAEVHSLSPRPTVFFGHSMGAVLAFETAWRLEQQGDPNAPAVVVASGRRGPATHREESVHERDDAGLLAEVRHLAGTDATLLQDEEVVQMVLPAIRGDFRAIETYRCPSDRRLVAAVTAIIGYDDPKSSVAEARTWQEHTTGAFRLVVMPGGHFYLIPLAAEVNAELARELACVTREVGARG